MKSTKLLDFAVFLWTWGGQVLNWLIIKFLFVVFSETLSKFGILYSNWCFVLFEWFFFFGGGGGGLCFYYYIDHGNSDTFTFFLFLFI